MSTPIATTPGIVTLHVERTDELPDLSRITVEAGKLGGRPCIRRMRIGVSDILDLLSAKEPIDTILEDYPDLERDDIYACLAFAALAVDDPVHRAR